MQQLPQADCILLPLPLEQSGLPLAQLLGMAKPGALALGGKVTDSARTIARAAGVELVDYFARPELTVYNAIPTAEGCIGILLERRSVPCGARRSGAGLWPGGGGDPAVNLVFSQPRALAGGAGPRPLWHGVPHPL